MSPDGKPIQVNASALHAATAQNTMGRYSMLRQKDVFSQELTVRIRNIYFNSRNIP